LAGRGWGRVHPNPMVGCVLTRDGERVGEGWHEEYGGPHAEVNAIRSAGDAAHGATAYVSLEPCNHHGKTPPCSKVLLKAGVARVVFGASDPGDETGGGGEHLAQAGVEVIGPSADVWTFHDVDPVFFHTMRYRRPYLALKLAVSLDGRIAARAGERTPLTGEEANREVHRLRSGFDAVLVGGETARVDDPLLTVRYGMDPRIPPTRIVLDPSATLPPDASLFRTESEAPVLIFATAAASAERVDALRDAGAQVEIVPQGEPVQREEPEPQGDGGANLEKMLERCWSLGVRSVFCEGGGRLATALTCEKLARRLYLFQAPLTLGAQGVPAFGGGDSTPEGLGWSSRGESIRFGPDVLLTYDREADV
jgi:diaminohydroxyphosphoribosylaminopyrimidine deaminase/5-amino-6-(5-phosphoribosylamino)uracil reductase